jgi:hypothetical protein
VCNSLETIGIHCLKAMFAFLLWCADECSARCEGLLHRDGHKFPECSGSVETCDFRAWMSALVPNQAGWCLSVDLVKTSRQIAKTNA